MKRRMLLTYALAAILAWTAPLASEADALGDGSRPARGSLQGCAPLGAGTDIFPATATFAVNDVGFGEPFILRLSSSGNPDVTIQRGVQIGDTVTMELIHLELSGFHPRVGQVTLRHSTNNVSLGVIENVTLDGSCELNGGDVYLDLFVEMELTDLGQTWYNPAPFRIATHLTALPPSDARYEVDDLLGLQMLDVTTDDPRGEMLYALLHADPPFPESGTYCFESLLTADLFLFDEGATASLVGFGPINVLRGAVDPGGVCNLAGTPCTSDLECSGLDTCKRQRLETEIVDMEIQGFDGLLGSWQANVLPGGGDSDCCTDNGTPGCSDAVCQDLICGMDPFCCNVTWDSLCASLASNEPACVANCVNPDAAPSVGEVQSIQLDRSYPAGSLFDVVVEIDSALKGSMRNASPLPVQPLTPLRNLPPTPQTNYRYLGTPISVLDEDDVPVGEISNFQHTLQPPKDCQAPPAGNEDCFDASLQVDIELAPCPPESLALTGEIRMLRGDPYDPVGLGQENIDAVMAWAEYGGVSGCSGPLTLRLSSAGASTGEIASLAPEEFFPAGAYLDLQLEVESPSGTLTAGSSTIATTINALPPDAGEVYVGPGSPVDLLDDGMVKVGELTLTSQLLLQSATCQADSLAAISFPGPSKSDLLLGVPQGGAGLIHDLVRGDLESLRTSGGSFASAVCIATDVGASASDPDTPTSGAGFYYVARDGFQSFNGTWNSLGPAQQGNRDLLIPSCP